MVATPLLEIVLCRLWWSQISLFFFTLKEICLCGRVDRKWNDLKRVSLLISNTVVQIPPDQPTRRISTLLIVRDPEKQLSLGRQRPLCFCLWTQDVCQPMHFPLIFHRISLCSSGWLWTCGSFLHSLKGYGCRYEPLLGFAFCFFFQFWISILSRKYITS